MTEALAHNNMKIVKILAEQGADINIKNNEGMTALDIAKERINFAFDKDQAGDATTEEVEIVKEVIKYLESLNK